MPVVSGSAVSSPATLLPDTGPGAGTYGGGANFINSVTLDAQGRVTAAVTGTVSNTLLTGAAGGQTVIGGTASGEGLFLSSTSHATKGPVGIGTNIGTDSFAVSFTLGLAASPLANAGILIGESAANHFQAYWTTGNGTAANAVMDLRTASFSNPIRMDASALRLQSQIGGNAGNVLIGTATENTSSAAKLRVNTARTLASAAGLIWDGIDAMTSTLTLSGATNVTTTTGLNMVNFAQPTITAGSALTVSLAATVYIAGPPVQAGSATITAPYSLWIDSGKFRLDGKIALGGGSAATLGTIGGSGPASAAQNGWIPLNTDGTNGFMPFWT